MSVSLLLHCILATNPWCDAVVSFDPGMGATPGYDNPSVVLGPPEQMSGEGTEWESVVSPFSPAWGPDEIVSIGLGGQLIIRFDEPVVDEPQNAHGIDLIVYGNPGFIDLTPPEGLCGGIFGGDGGTIEVSPDGIVWTEIPTVGADGGWPTLAWIDAGPYDPHAGTIPTDPTLAMSPDVAIASATGLQWPDLVALYDGASGGTGIDLAVTGMPMITHVRLAVPENAFFAVEVDAVVDAGVWLAADLDGNGIVDVNDLLLVIGAWGQTGGTGDIDGDSVVGINDLLLVLESWT